MDFNGQEVPFNWECGIFMTLNPNEACISNFNQSMKEKFRLFNMLTPDITQIT